MITRKLLSEGQSHLRQPMAPKANSDYRGE